MAYNLSLCPHPYTPKCLYSHGTFLARREYVRKSTRIICCSWSLNIRDNATGMTSLNFIPCVHWIDTLRCSLNIPHEEITRTVKSGERGGHKPRLTICLPGTLFSFVWGCNVATVFLCCLPECTSPASAWNTINNPPGSYVNKMAPLSSQFTPSSSSTLALVTTERSGVPSACRLIHTTAVNEKHWHRRMTAIHDRMSRHECFMWHLPC